MITLIAAVNKHMLLGKDNNMPWHVKEDLRYFKCQTLHKELLMGRKTFESLPTILKDRTIYVLTKQRDYVVEADNVHVIHTIEPLIDAYLHSEKELMVAGGGMVYSLMMPYAHKLLISVIDDDQHGDVYFPNIDQKQFTLKQIIDMKTFSLREYVRYG